MPRETRSLRLNFRVTNEEKHAIQKLACQEGVSVSEYVRQEVLAQSEPSNAPGSLLNDRLCEIGDELALITASAKQRGRVPSEDLLTVLNQLERSLEGLRFLMPR